ncbi:MAG: FAD-binding oxidoreductase [Planctomycetes bacterium]|nr:FAD-binding oxidoreductase [Planctomycetota bacterium]
MKLPVVDSGQMPTGKDIEALADSIEGEVRFDRHDRMLYATDASMYQVEPLGVVIPVTTDDVAKTIAWCARHGLPVLPRGGGTSLAGQTVSRAVVVDCSKHLRGVGDVDAASSVVCVEPGAVLDDVQQRAAECSLMFGPEVSTSTHATLGGMISNRSAGLHSLRWGMTDEHVRSVDVILADGEQVRFERGAASRSPRVADLTKRIVDVIEPLADEIDARYPRIRRNVGGYALDRILQDIRRCKDGSLDEIDLSALFAGSEGTLGFIVGATLGLVPKPARTVLAVLAFADVQSALRELPTILGTDPAAVELLDHTVLEAARSHPTYASLASMLPRLPDSPAGAVLYVDWFAEDDAGANAVVERLREIADVPMRVCVDEREKADLWRLRKVGLGLILSGEGSLQPVGGLEDCAVPPERLAEFQEAFDGMLSRHGCSATYYAHASVGLLHIRPRIDLGSGSGKELLKKLGHEATQLVQQFGGTISGEHGDGRIRAGMVHEFYGPRLVEAFQQIKHVFDPEGRFNPGNITSDRGMTDDLRITPLGSAQQASALDTAFDWKPSLVDAAASCNGNGTAGEPREGPCVRPTGPRWMNATQRAAEEMRSGSRSPVSLRVAAGQTGMIRRREPRSTFVSGARRAGMSVLQPWIWLPSKRSISHSHIERVVVRHCELD